MQFYEDKRFSFWELFNENNGTLFRSNVTGTRNDPLMRSFPELIDVGIMGHCESGKKGFCKAVGVDCYQQGFSSRKANMPFSNYKLIVDEAKGKTFQIALGGAGDPNKHENIEKILQYTRENNIIPNMTTSGFEITEREIALIAEYCGAVAVSYYSKLISGNESNEHTLSAISRLKSLIPTNIHYVISEESVDEATYRLENEKWPKGVNAIIFLLYKPVGFGISSKVIRRGEKICRFMNAALKRKHEYRIGFDTCFTPILLDYRDCIEMQSVDFCEAARFSMYIDSEMNAYPCSFDNQIGKYKISLDGNSIQSVWDSPIFEQFRNRITSCDTCDAFHICKGGCALDLGINVGSKCNMQRGNT